MDFLIHLISDSKNTYSTTPKQLHSITQFETNVDTCSFGCPFLPLQPANRNPTHCNQVVLAYYYKVLEELDTEVAAISSQKVLQYMYFLNYVAFISSLHEKYKLEALSWLLKLSDYNIYKNDIGILQSELMNNNSTFLEPLNNLIKIYSSINR